MDAPGVTVYFLTGATGVVGSAFLQQILAEPRTEIRLLVRAGGAGAEARVRALVGRLGLAWNTVATRIRVLEGDVRRPHLGLSEAEFSEIGASCSHVVHCAGNVKGNLPEDEAERIAVGAVAGVLDLARLGRSAGVLRKVEVLSTIGVAGRTQGRIPEDRLAGVTAFHNSYERAKWKAERLAWEAVDEGLPVTLHRPSMIIGDSEQGSILQFQVFYYICEFLSVRQTWGFLPDFRSSSLDVVPIDFVVDALHWSCHSSDSVGRVLHLCAGPSRPLHLAELVEHVGRAYERNDLSLPRRRIVPRGLFKGLIPVGVRLAPAGSKRRLRTLHFFLDYLSEHFEFENNRTTTLLGSAGIEPPRPQEYLEPVLDYYLRNRGRMGQRA